MPGSSEYFVGGFITYSNAMKMELLGVPPEDPARSTARSASKPPKPWRSARAAAPIPLTRSPSPEPRGRIPPTKTFLRAPCTYGLADAAGTLAVHRQFLGDRQRVRTFAAQMALDLLRRRITGKA